MKGKTKNFAWTRNTFLDYFMHASGLPSIRNTAPLTSYEAGERRDHIVTEVVWEK